MDILHQAKKVVYPPTRGIDLIFLGVAAGQGLTLFTIHSLFLFHRTKGADEKIAEGMPAVIGEVAGSGAGKRI